MVVSDLLRGVAWPVAIIWIATLFHREIKTLILQIREVGPKGMRIAPSVQSEADSDKITGEKISKLKLEDLKDPVAIQIEDSTRKILKEIPEDEREARLIRALTLSQINKDFMLIYSNIFGSQIRALRTLNSGPISTAEASKYFGALKMEFPVFTSWNIDSYLRYLIHWKLIEQHESEYYITETGRNFLRFIVDNRLSEDRGN